MINKDPEGEFRNLELIESYLESNSEVSCLHNNSERKLIFRIPTIFRISNIQIEREKNI